MKNKKYFYSLYLRVLWQLKQMKFLKFKKPVGVGLSTPNLFWQIYNFFKTFVIRFFKKVTFFIIVVPFFISYLYKEFKGSLPVWDLCVYLDDCWCYWYDKYDRFTSAWEDIADRCYDDAEKEFTYNERIWKEEFSRLRLNFFIYLRKSFVALVSNPIKFLELSWFIGKLSEHFRFWVASGS
jgi:hypothetical protein